ncbi:MAG: hypothetical protein R2776_02215 [Flavobacteriaceae bacterium]|nr:hypothetical protein [Flavobacteriaceae bacterium]
MKKELQKKLKELATSILASDSLMEIAEMKEQARTLYEKLSVLEYFEAQITGNTNSEIIEESFDSKSFREQNWFKDPKPVPSPENKEEIVEPATEKIKDIVAQMPEESQKMEALLEEVLPTKQFQKNDLEDFAAHYKEMPVFERKELPESSKTSAFTETMESPKPAESSKQQDSEKPKSINDTISSGLTIGLNDRIAFIKHLFNGNAEDYTRVLSQINTMPSFEKAQEFIKGRVKPDYNYWLHKEEYSERFMTIIEKRFN